MKYIVISITAAEPDILPGAVLYYKARDITDEFL